MRHGLLLGLNETKIVVSLAAVAAILLSSSAIVAGEGNAKEVFRTTSPDGRLITVTRSEHVEHVAPTADDRARLPKGAIPLERDVTVLDYTAHLSPGKSDAATVLWRKSHRCLTLGSPGMPDELFVHDIALRGARAAILYSGQGVGVDVVERQDDGRYSLLWSEELFQESEATRSLRAGRLAWLGGLYALVETTVDEEEVWRVDRGDTRVVCKRTGLPPSP